MQDFQFNHSNRIDVTLRLGLHNVFYDTTGKEMDDINCHYFAHHLIQNYRQEGWAVSSFNTNPDWQTKYWSEYWDRDPLERECHKIAQLNGFIVSSWQVVDPNSDVMEERKSACRLSTGFSFYVQHKEGILENFSFGWEKYDIASIGHEKLLKLSNLINHFRENHLNLYKENLK